MATIEGYIEQASRNGAPFFTNIYVLGGIMTYIPTYKFCDFFSNQFGTHLTKADGHLHSHDYWEIFYVVQGVASHRLNDTYSMLSAGTIYILKPYKIHAFNDIENSTALHRDIAVTDELFRQTCQWASPDLYENLLCSEEDIFPIPIEACALSTLENRLNHFCMIPEENEECRSQVAKLILNYIFLLYLENINVNIHLYPDPFSSILAEMKSPDVLQFGIEQLLAKTGFSHGHLCRLFKKYTGKTMLAILTSNRMQHAAALIRSSEYSLLEISEMVGYDSLSHFIRNFKAYYQQPPSAYRKKYRIKQFH